MTKLNYILLFMLSFATHTHLHAAQMNVEVKEQAEQIKLTAEEQAAAKRVFEIINATNKNNAAQQAQALQKLLQRYPRIVDAKDSDGTTPLMLPAFNRYIEIVKLLITADADLNAQDNDGLTALMQAAIEGNTEIVKLLIAAGAQIDAQDIDGWTPLMHAALNGYAETVKLLIAAGAQIDAQDNDGDTACDVAIAFDHQSIYDEAVAAGLAEKERYEQAQQVAKQKITEVMFPDEIEEPEITEIIGEYAYNPKITGDLPQETPLEKAQRITKEIREKKKQKALSCACKEKR